MNSLTKKISLAPQLWLLSAIIFLMIVGTEIYSLYLEREQLKENFFREARASLETASSDIGPALWLHQADFLINVLTPLANKPDVSFLYLSDVQGKRVHGFKDGSFGALINEFKNQELSEYDDGNHLLIRQAVIFNEDPQGHLVMGFSRQWLRDSMAEKIRKTAIATAALTAALFFLTIIFSRRLSRPLTLASKIIRAYIEKENLTEEEFAAKNEDEILQSIESSAARMDFSSAEILFQLTPLPLVISDAGGKVENANRSACKFFEMNHPELLSSHLKTLLGENDFRVIQNHIENSAGDLNGYLAGIAARDGGKRIAELNIALLKNEEDRLKGYVMAFRDVSDNFSTRQEILENQNRMAAFNRKLFQKARELKSMQEKNIKYAGKLAQLIQISYDIIRCNTNQEILDILVSGGSRLVDAEECIIFLREGDKKRLDPVKTFPAELLKKLKPLPENNGVIWKTYRDNRSCFINGKSLQEQDVGDLGIAGAEMPDVIAAPISDRDYHYGVAVYLQRRKNVLFTEDMHLITALAHQSAITLDKIQLFDALKEKAGHLEKANFDLKNSRQQVVHLQKMESLGTLVGGIAHDFNNILGIIIPNIDLLRRGAGNNPEILKRADTIQEAAERAAELNRQMLMFSHTREVKPAPLSPNQLIRQIVTMLRKALGENIAVQLKLDPATPDIYADEARLSQALMNLAINARDAMPTGGTITFLTGVEDYAPPANPEAIAEKHVKISIKDSGTGIPKENLAKIFDPFFTTKGVDKGTGLGLSVVYGIVKSHQGYIEVESGPGQGAAFHLYFKPMKAVAEPAEEPQLSGYNSNGNENILVVDDEAGIREMLAELLESLGYKVFLAESGKTAVEIARNNKDIHMAIVDYTMPKMNGIETIKAIHQLDGNIRVLLSSGYADQARIIRKYPKIDGFLPKPYHIDEVAKIVKKSLKKRIVSEN